MGSAGGSRGIGTPGLEPAGSTARMRRAFPWPALGLVVLTTSLTLVQVTRLRSIRADRSISTAHVPGYACTVCARSQPWRFFAARMA